jgi:hypothetical protein
MANLVVNKLVAAANAKGKYHNMRTEGKLNRYLPKVNQIAVFDTDKIGVVTKVIPGPRHVVVIMTDGTSTKVFLGSGDICGFIDQ